MSQAMKHQRVHKANVRASETPVQTMNRQEQNKARMASMRASETLKFALCNADHVNFKLRNYHVLAYNISILAEGLHFSALVLSVF